MRFNTAITAKGISYRHREASAPALKSLNFSIPKGAALGIVGPSGAGKTTLVDVLMAILPPSSGALLVDNVVISEQNASHWRRLIGYVPQELRLIDGSLAENIAFTTDRSKIDLGRVESVSKIAQLHDFIKELPNGYSTQAGELGARLSGGQQQRVAIARALYREPEVLILDEATSALDPVTEAAYRSALAELRGKCTSIQVAHRVTTLRDCDMILVLDKGVIVNIGTYEELVKVNKWFQQASRA